MEEEKLYWSQMITEEIGELLGWNIMWLIFASLLVSVIITCWYFFGLGVKLGEYLRVLENEA